MRNKTKKLVAVSLCTLGAISLTVSLEKQASPFDFNAVKERSETMQYLSNNGKFASDYYTLADTQVAAADLNEAISEEGNTLLKNDGTLPLRKGAFVSIFGNSQTNIVGNSSASGQTSDRIKTPAESLEAEGYHVNPTLLNYYETHTTSSSGGGGFAPGNSSGGSYGKEEVKFNSNVTNSLGMYDDCGFVFLSRAGGEGSDAKLTIDEEQDYTTDENGTITYEHANEVSGKKHYLELTDQEQDLIELAKKTCKKVVILLNTSNVMEIGGLRDDDQINAIMWIGRPGESGMKAVGELISGSVNPSGRTVDTWAYDFSKDPTWFNFGNNSQVGRTDTNMYYYADGDAAGAVSSGGGPGSSGFYGVDYEEGIYMGYRYYETRYYEMVKNVGAEKADAWYKTNVAYPFGYGLTYSKFSFAINGLYTDSACTVSLTDEEGKLDATKVESSTSKEADIKALYVPVTVTNTGNVAGKQTVQVYVTAPYAAGKTAKSFVKLVGYSKTSYLGVGASETVVVKVEMQDIASFDEDDANSDNNKGYELDLGKYTIRAMDSSHVKLNDSLAHVDDDRPYAEASFELTGSKAAALKVDDYSGEEVEPRLVDTGKEIANYSTIRKGFNTTTDDEMTLLSRDDLGTEVDLSSYTKEQATAAESAGKHDTTTSKSFPRPQLTSGRTFNQDFWDDVFIMEMYDADNTNDYAKYDTKSGDDALGWAISNDDIPSTWTQAKTTATSNTIKLKDMAGKALRDENGDISSNWTAFMNQLSWEEICRVVSNGGYCTADVDSVDKIEGFDLDDPLDLDNSYGWTDEPTVAATFNTDLGRKQGIITGNLGMFKRTDGWYGPGMNTHRSPFGGRNCQYYSEDGMCAGIMAAAVVNGAQSRGLNCIVKHLALNEQETNRAGDCLFNWASEQSIREIYLVPFQKALQEGGASGAMTACVRIGMMSASASYAVNQEIVHDEWGWDGFLLTDGYTGVERPNPVDLMVRTGNDLPLGNVSGGTGIGPNTYSSINVNIHDKDATDKKVTINRDDKISGTWDSTLRDGKGGVKVGGVEINYYNKTEHSADKKTFDAVESPVQYYNARMIATRVLYTAANSQTNHNGIKMVRGTTEDIWVDWDKSGDLGTLAQGSESTLTIAPKEGILEDDTITSYEITDGELPEGLTLNDDGTITGTVTGDAGTYSFTVKLYADYWNTQTATFSITVTSSFAWSSQGYNSGKVGKSFVGIVDTTLDTTDKTITYSASSLPDGLTLDSSTGRVSGTPTEAGTYDIEFTATITETKSNNNNNQGGGQYYGGGPGGGQGQSQSKSTVYTFTLQLVIAEGDAVEVEDYSAEIAELKAAVEALKSSNTSSSSSITSLEASLAALETKVTALEGKDYTSSLSTEITSLKSEIATLKSEIASLKESGDKEESSSGCGGSIIVASSAIAALGLIGASLAIKKRKED